MDDLRADSLTNEGTADAPEPPDQAKIAWIERVLPGLARDLLGASSLDDPVAQLPIAQFRLIRALPFDDVGETMGRLSERMHMLPSALTQAANRVVRTGLVERVPDPDDRRLVRLRLTASGRKWTDERSRRRQERLGLIWGHIDQQDRVGLLEAVQTLERISRRAAAMTGGEQRDVTTTCTIDTLPSASSSDEIEDEKP